MKRSFEINKKKHILLKNLENLQIKSRKTTKNIIVNGKKIEIVIPEKRLNLIPKKINSIKRIKDKKLNPIPSNSIFL